MFLGLRWFTAILCVVQEHFILTIPATLAGRLFTLPISAWGQGQQALMAGRQPVPRKKREMALVKAPLFDTGDLCPAPIFSDLCPNDCSSEGLGRVQGQGVLNEV